jgi:hypothetical protein
MNKKVNCTHRELNETYRGVEVIARAEKHMIGIYRGDEMSFYIPDYFISDNTRELNDTEKSVAGHIEMASSLFHVGAEDAECCQCGDDLNIKAVNSSQAEFIARTLSDHFSFKAKG